MKIENQVCSLEQGKRLKELGVNAPSTYYWSDYLSRPSEFLLLRRRGKGIHYDEKGYFDLLHFFDEKTPKNTYPAFTVAELGIMYPSDFNDLCAQIQRTTATWKGQLAMDNRTLFNPHFMADCLIAFLENNLIKVEDVNARLIADAQTVNS